MCGFFEVEHRWCPYSKVNTRRHPAGPIFKKRQVTAPLYTFEKKANSFLVHGRLGFGLYHKCQIHPVISPLRWLISTSVIFDMFHPPGEGRWMFQRAAQAQSWGNEVVEDLAP